MRSRLITSAEAACETIREGRRFTIWGSGSKGSLRAPAEEAQPLDIRRMAGMVEYDPGEFTFTARAGTPLSEIVSTLAASGQYLPFDPMLTGRGATLGGCIASGLSGPGRYRYGGVRDFIIGVRFVDGGGRLIRGGGKVVKNAAGFDFPKLMVGACGRLGLLTEATFKVFPKPQATLTAMVKLPLITKAVQVVSQLSRLPLDLDALELMPPGEIVLRIAGDAEALPARLESIRKATGLPWGKLSEKAAAEMWQALTQMEWVEGFTSRVRVPLTPDRVMALDGFLDPYDVTRLYSVGCNLAWIAWPPTLKIELLHQQLTRLKLSGQQLDGLPVRLGINRAQTVENIIKQALDPEMKFGPLP